VAATKLLLQAPSIKPALESGKLSLTSAAQVQRFVERERRLSGIVHSPQQITAAIEGKSKREVEQELFNRASPKTQAAMNERVKPVLKIHPKHAKKIGSANARQVQVSATVDETLIEEARSLVYTESVSELIERALTLYVQHHAKRRGKVDPRASLNAASAVSDGDQVEIDQKSESGVRNQKGVSSTAKPNSSTERDLVNAASPCRQSSSMAQVQTQVNSARENGGPPNSDPAPAPQRKFPASSPRTSISIHLKRATWSRARAQCEFKNDSGERCPATSALEIDHRFPVSLGGASSPQNLQLLCRTHNQIKGRRIE
jgi:hypothetical protein